MLKGSHFSHHVFAFPVYLWLWEELPSHHLVWKLCPRKGRGRMIGLCTWFPLELDFLVLPAERKEMKKKRDNSMNSERWWLISSQAPQYLHHGQHHCPLALNFSKLTFLDTTDTVLASFKSEMKLGESPDGFKDRVLAHELSTWLIFKCFIRKLTNNRRI